MPATVQERQDPLRKRYRDEPKEAWLTDEARAHSPGADAFHGVVAAGGARGIDWRYGIHSSVGGYHDLPNPGDILCAALAACLDSTTRLIAERMGVPLASLEVDVSAEADARGCLMVDPEVPAGFQRIRVEARPVFNGQVEPERVAKLFALAERCCVVLQTLRSDVSISLSISPSSG